MSGFFVRISAPYTHTHKLAADTYLKLIILTHEKWIPLRIVVRGDIELKKIARNYSWRKYEPWYLLLDGNARKEQSMSFDLFKTFDQIEI